MSRTKRRKNVRIPDYRLMDYVFDEAVGYWKDVPYADNEFKKIIAKHHSDHGYYVSKMPVPKVYIKMCNHYFRAKMKAEVKNIYLTENYEEYSFSPHKKDAAYLYW